MGDEDAENAWSHLAGMKAIIESDDSGYYEVPLTLEESLREKHPALQDAYEQYQSILTLAKAEHYSREVT